jgi:hypothetical protein
MPTTATRTGSSNWPASLENRRPANGDKTFPLGAGPATADDTRVSRRNREPFWAQPRRNAGDLWPPAVRDGGGRADLARLRAGFPPSFQDITESDRIQRNLNHLRLASPRRSVVMRVRVGWLALAAAGLFWLAGCQTLTKLSETKLPDPLAPQPSAVADEQPTGSTGSDKPPPVSPQLLGTDPNDDLSTAKKYFRQGSYGLAERYFRKAVEQHPRDAEAWLGLAAAYDRLKRFDLADRAYAQALNLVGATPEVLNNQGFSYMLRGDYRRARVTLLEAQAKAPDNRYIKNNLRLLGDSERKAKAVR